MRYSITKAAEFPIISEEDFSLFQVCHQMRSEAVEIFYKHTCAVISVDASGKSLMSTEYPFLDFYPLRVPTWAFAIRNWQIVLTYDQSSAVGRIPIIAGWKMTDSFRDACNLLSRVEKLDSLTVILPCRRQHRTEQLIGTKALFHPRIYRWSDHIPSQDGVNLETEMIDFYTILNVLLRPLQAKKGICLHVACHQPECLELLQRAVQNVDLKQPPEVGMFEEGEGYELLKHRAKHILDRQQLGEEFRHLAEFKYRWLILHYAEAQTFETGCITLKEFLADELPQMKDDLETILDRSG
ncbi:MAG: hypothetical protein LQ350_007507 [Teloschistes chrysophthalmus]|nr:MAG: hypothetical protein LQ350_007507 [Niorma chrysophthalma]